MEGQPTEIEAGGVEDGSEVEQGFVEDWIRDKEEYSSEPDSERDQSPLPSLEEAEALISEKTKLLMDELFRARIQRVKRIDPKEIR
ncbi:MAG: hypothetical protein MKZ70_07915 [Opitutales bacterium]|nr:hypothetical protein [Opitutales bacterium]